MLLVHHITLSGVDQGQITTFMVPQVPSCLLQ